MDLSGLKFKEKRMQTPDQSPGSVETNGKITLEMLSKMTGFPVDYIKEEVFDGLNPEQISIEALREAMLKYIDSSILLDSSK